MKIRAIVFSAVIALALLAGCAKQPSPNTQTTTTATTTTSATNTTTTTTTTGTSAPDAISAASVTDNPDVFAQSIGSNGKWIICITKDLTINKELTLEGTFMNGKKDDKGNAIIQRKIGLYTQDANRKITARFTLTAPKLTIKSPNASIQHGTFKGDLYVAVKDFQLIDATVEGNVYFASDEAKNTFKMDATSKVTGKQEVKK